MAGQHAKPKEKNTKIRNIATFAGIAVGGTTASMLMAPQAQASPISSWDKIAQCEASGDWFINHSSDGLSVGGLQFQNPSWHTALSYLNSHGTDTSTWTQNLYQGMPRASIPSKEQQIRAGEALLAVQSANGAWVCNRPGYSSAGALADSGPLASHYKGGINPYPSGTPAPNPTPTPTPTPTPSPSPSAPVKHTVVKGDTLFGIAKANYGDGEQWKTLYELNKSVVGSNPNLIYPGQVLTVYKTYTVKKGDTLITISKTLKIANWMDLYKLNKSVIGGNPDLIEIGQVLRIPVVSTPVATTPAPTTPAPSTASYVRPIAVPPSSNVFRTPGSYTLGYHTGVDFSASTGTRVNSVSNGVVVSSDTSWSYGTNVQIKNADGTYALYAHLSSKSVSVGQSVTAGQQIGKVGSTGNSSGSHLHFEIRIVPQFGAGNFLDPLAWLRKHGVSI